MFCATFEVSTYNRDKGARKTMFNEFLFELLGTFVLVAIDGSIAANLLWKGSANEGKGSLPLGAVGAFLAVTLGVTLAALVTGGHINPMFTVGMLLNGNITLTSALLYISGQLVGGFLGALVVAFYYRQNRLATSPELQVAPLAGVPEAPRYLHDFITSAVASTFFAGFILLVVSFNLGSLTPTFVGVGVATSILAFSGTSGAALNPARDLGPRLVAKLLGAKNVALVYGLVISAGSLLGGIVGVSLVQLLINLI